MATSTGRHARDRQAARAVTLLGALRLVFGVAMVAAPPVLARLLGADRMTAGRLGYLSRMVGGRELALGLGTLQAQRDGLEVRPWVAAQALSDAGDAIAVAAAMRRGDVSPLPGAAVVVAGAVGAAADIALLRMLATGG